MDLKKARRKRALSQWQLALAVNRSQATISLWELGFRKPSPDEHKRIAKVLGVDPKKLNFSKVAKEQVNTQ